MDSSFCSVNPIPRNDGQIYFGLPWTFVALVAQWTTSATNVVAQYFAAFLQKRNETNLHS